MAHELEIIDGQAQAFFVGQQAWHGLGILLPNPPTIQEGISYAGLDWQVKLQPIYLEDKTLISGNSAVVRESDNSILGVVGERYTPLQNIDAFDFFNPFLESGLVQLEAAGSLKQGRRIWVLAKIKEDMIIKGDDVVQKYILLANSHDGSLAITAGYTPIRVVCNNTLSMATGGKSGSQLLKIRHTSSAQMTLDKVRETMNIVNQTFEATAEQYRFLTTKIINEEQLREYVKIVFKQDMIEKSSTRSINQLDQVYWLFENGQGNRLPGVKHTAWAAYNAVTDFLSHQAGNSEDGRMNSLWFGSNAKRNELALQEAVNLVQGK